MASRTAQAEKFRAALAEELRPLVERAGVSRQSRRAACDQFRQWYDLGSDSSVAAVNNKIRAHIDRLGSYVWTADAVRFSVDLPPAAREHWLEPASTARDEFRRMWADSGADLTISLAIEWAFVQGAGVLKTRPMPGGFAVDYIEPWDFGVTREDVPYLEDQDIACHWYSLSQPQFERWIKGHPREDEWKKQALNKERVPSMAPGAPSIVVAGIGGSFPNSTITSSLQGDIGPMALYQPSPMVREPVYEFCDVWQKRLYPDPKGGVFEDWRVTTAWADDLQPLVIRRNPILGHVESPAGVALPAEFPFAMLVPRPLPYYLWGRSEMLALMGLQIWRETQITQMREVITRQLNPSRLYVGIPDASEVGRAMDSPGGYAGAPEGSKMETIKVEVGQEAFGMLTVIDQMFDDQSGIPSTLQGDQPPGVRANDQLISLAGIGAGRIRHMALQIEATLSRVATLGFRIVQRTDDQVYTASDGTRFLLAQLPPGTSLKVSAHSASPIFAEQTAQKAAGLLQAGAIDPIMYTELVDPPHREEIKALAKKLGESRAQMQERFLELELEKIRRRRGRM